jgi:Anti-sigma-K factor rskA/Putative zinc-finger
MIHWLAHKLGLKTCPGCDTLVEYAMDGLPESQQENVRRHLADCPPCREQVRDYWQVREGLGLCSQQHEAPPDICSKVLARLDEQPRRAPAEQPMAVQPARHLGGWPRFWMLLGPAFAALSLVMTVVALAALMDRKAVPAPDNEMASIADAIMNDPRSAHVALAGAGPAAAASGLLVLCPGMDHAYFRGDGLSPSPLGYDYVLWITPQAGPPRRLARFTVEEAGGGVHLLQFDSAFAGSGPVEFTVTGQKSDSKLSGRTWLKGGVNL